MRERDQRRNDAALLRHAADELRLSLMAKSRRSIVTGDPGRSRQSISKPPLPEAKQWTFSFRFWRQQDELFGLGTCDPAWFVSLLDRFHELSREKVVRFQGGDPIKDGYRYHGIDWAAKNIPMTRVQFDWLPPEYRDNETEFEFVQFHISKAEGRVIGFWDEEWVFNLLLLDRMHNLQPSKYNDYETRSSPVLQCQYTHLLFSAKAAMKMACNGQECSVSKEFERLLSNHPQHRRVVILQVEDADFTNVKAAIDLECAATVGEVITAGVNALMNRVASP
ncbi:MAG: hypothetical protein ACRC8S_03010 [Fimbriiglobus sp.]